jgi:hypothetical protein
MNNKPILVNGKFAILLSLIYLLILKLVSFDEKCRLFSKCLTERWAIFFIYIRTHSCNFITLQIEITKLRGFLVDERKKMSKGLFGSDDDFRI